ncbi:NAD(P)H-binding protein [Photobacterium toruni]|uniref:Quinone oxidoreductase 2 n=1 Tax=Photobacterium toruni TaxID=1935446 RepID=A0A1T4ST62_9GAMM|nr:NAD(P)H-binding protein [Photobacterium toruni]SKA31332.1 Quinone oxidoreductase 2 [Photobacterium toruni]
MILITGASGNLGQLVIKELLNNEANFVAGVRNISKYNGYHCNLAPLDYDNIDIMKDSLNNIDTIIFISGNSDTEHRIQQHRNLIDVAKEKNVKHIIYLSFITVTDPYSKFSFTRQHVDTESYLKASGINHTIVRSCWYMENIETEIINALDNNIFIDNSKTGKISFISRQDVAKGLANIAMNTNLQGKIYSFTGSAAYSMQDIVDLMNTNCHKQITYIPYSNNDYKQRLIDAKLPLFLSEAITLNSIDIDNGDYAFICQDIYFINKKSPVDINDYILSICCIH